MNIKPARPGDTELVVAFRNEAAQWLSQRGIDQWQEPWPNHAEMCQRIDQSIEAGETWIVWDGEIPAASVALDTYADPRLWTDAERKEPAHYLHRLTVSRTHSGQDLGGKVLDWASRRAYLAGAHWLRIDIWTHNLRLRRYYEDHSFCLVRVRELPDYPSGALLQRKTALECVLLLG